MNQTSPLRTIFDDTLILDSLNFHGIIRTLDILIANYDTQTSFHLDATFFLKGAWHKMMRCNVTKGKARIY